MHIECISKMAECTLFLIKISNSQARLSTSAFLPNTLQLSVFQSRTQSMPVHLTCERAYSGYEIETRLSLERVWEGAEVESLACEVALNKSIYFENQARYGIIVQEVYI
jgi:hypothetical protein